ncbi:MAG: PAS domain S-box protein [Bacteroidetes bacterium]|nr:PAS domain S-box protein [Bacteroidota bacterium]
MVIAICEKFRKLLLGFGIEQYVDNNIISIFSEISERLPIDYHVIETNEWPKVFDLHIQSASEKNLIIRWVTSPLAGDYNIRDGWQLTGMRVPSSKTSPHMLTVGEAIQLQKEKNLSDSIINSMPGIFYLIDHNGKFLRWNKRMETVSGYNYNEIADMHPLDFFEDGEKNYIASRIEKVFIEGISDAEANLFTKNGRKIPHFFTGQLIQFENKPCLIGMGIDINERKKAEQLIALEKKVLEINSDQGASLKKTIDCFLSGIEKIFPDMICSVLTLDEDGVSIRPLSSPGLPLEYSQALDGIRIGATTGSCGTAMFLKRKIIVSNIETDPLWHEYKNLPLAFDLRACWSLPIIDSKDEVLACFATYYRFTKTPTIEELAFIERAADLIKIIIENKKAEEKIKFSNERYVLATKATNDTIWDWDLKSGHCFWGEGFYTQFGYKNSDGIHERKFWETHIHPLDQQRVINSKENFISNSSDGVWSEEYRFEKADGNYAVISDRGFLVLDKEKNVSRVIGSMQDITEKKNMEKKLLQQELSKHKSIAQAMIHAQEKERAEIGQELHDNVNQILSTGKLYLELAKANESEKSDLLEVCVENINTAINEIRKISRALIPSSIEDLGLTESINDLVEQINSTKSMNVEFYTVCWSDEQLNSAQKLMLFRIIQEQANNVLKHSGAHNLIIELELDEYENTIRLNISDDGQGFDPEKIKTKKSLGFSNIFSRVHVFDGKLSVVSAPEKGCKLNVQIPLHNSHLNKLYE